MFVLYFTMRRNFCLQIVIITSYLFPSRKRNKILLCLFNSDLVIRAMIFYCRHPGDKSKNFIRTVVIAVLL